MKHLLVVGTSEQSARNLGQDIVEARGEEITMLRNDLLKTGSDTIAVLLPHFKVTPALMRGYKFDEIHLIGDLNAVEVQAVKDATRYTGINGHFQNYEIHAVEPMGLRIKK